MLSWCTVEVVLSQIITLMVFVPGLSVSSPAVTDKRCEQAMIQCTAHAVASPTCMSAWWSILLDTAKSDHNNDCSVTRTDIQTDLVDHYDTNGDGQVCLAEWIARRTGYMGFSKQFAEWHWKSISNKDCVELEAWTLHMSLGDSSDKDVKSSDAKGEFMEHTIQLLLEFCREKKGAKMNSNRDCLSLVSMCGEKRSNLAVCQIPEAQHMTLQEKVLELVRSRDVNGDGTISSEEVESALKAEFDADGDECITLKEWTDKLTTTYQFSKIIAENEFLSTGGDTTKCVPASDLSAEYSSDVDIFTGVSALIGRIVTLCDSKPELYDSTRECAHLSYTCLTHFQAMAPCKQVVNTCGLLRARDCMRHLSKDQCEETTGQLAVAKELASLENHANDICDPYPFRLLGDPVSSECRTAMAVCAKETVIDGKCSDTWAKLQLDMMRRDVTNNCADDEDGVMFDIRNNYDTNGDGKVCESEWQTRRKDYLGLSEEFSQLVWEDTSKETCLPIKDVYKGNSSVENARSVHIQEFVKHLIDFCQTEENMEKDRDCYSLPAICIGKMSGPLACGQFGLNLLTLNQKLWSEARDADKDGDGTILEAEMESLLLDCFDTDDDTCVSLEEWKSRWSSIYGMSSDFGEFYYRELIKKGDCLKIGDVDIPADGISVAQRPAMLLQVLITMCDNDPGLYGTLPDCAQIADTCLSHFPSLPVCKPYIDSCGLNQYMTCIEELTEGACAAATDQWEIKTETARAKNQAKASCKANSVLASFDIHVENVGSQLDIFSPLVWTMVGIIWKIGS